MKFSGEMCFKIILKVTKSQGFTLSLEDTFFKKPQEGVKLTPPSRFRVKNSSQIIVRKQSKQKTESKDGIQMYLGFSIKLLFFFFI